MVDPSSIGGSMIASTRPTSGFRRSCPRDARKKEGGRKGRESKRGRPGCQGTGSRRAKTVDRARRRRALRWFRRHAPRAARVLFRGSGTHTEARTHQLTSLPPVQQRPSPLVAAGFFLLRPPPASLFSGQKRCGTPGLGSKVFIGGDVTAITAAGSSRSPSGRHVPQPPPPKLWSPS